MNIKMLKIETELDNNKFSSLGIFGKEMEFFAFPQKIDLK